MELLYLAYENKLVITQFVTFVFSVALLSRVGRIVQTSLAFIQGNRASESLDEGFEEVIVPARLFELPTV